MIDLIKKRSNFPRRSVRLTNIKSKHDLNISRCNSENCSNNARWGYKQEKDAVYCKLHRKDGMIKVHCISQYCQESNCIKMARFVNNNPSEYPQLRYCEEHKTDSMTRWY